MTKYSEETARELREGYEAAVEGVDTTTDAAYKAGQAFITEFCDENPEFPRRSVVAKLSSMDVYIANTYRSKTGGPVESKADIVEAIAALCGVTSENLPGLEQANKGTLLRLRGALTPEDEAEAEA